MAHHNHGSAGLNGGLEGLKVTGFQLLQSAVGGGKAVVGIAAGAAVAGEMLGGAQHTAVGQSFDHLRNHTGNQLGIGPEAAILDHGIVLVG